MTSNRDIRKIELSAARHAEIQLHALSELTYVAEMYPWGSEIQVETEAAVYRLSGLWFCIEWEKHEYLGKATTPEAMEYVRNTAAQVVANLNELTVTS